MATLEDSEVAEEFARAEPGGDSLDKQRMLGALRRKLFDEGPKVTSIGRFVVEQRLGAGANGVVYAAVDPQLERKVAIKLLRRNGSDVGGQRLIQEARTLAKLSHPNIVAVHEVGEHDDRVFLAMELVEGSTLASWILDGPHAVEEVVRVFLDAGRGLSAAHRAGLVHRDFKPANVLLDRDGSVRVADFGLARLSSGPSTESSERTLTSDHGEAFSGAQDVGLTATGALVGTPAYMAPELFGGAEATPQSDQYAFCVAMDEAFHRERRYSGRTLAELAANVASGSSSRRSSVGLPRRVRRALERGLNVDPARRFPTMDALLAELRPPRRRWLWLGPAVVGGAAAVAVAGMGAEDVDPCGSVGEEVTALWGAKAKRDVESGFRASGSAQADQRFAVVDARLDALVTRWVDTATQTCELERSEAPPSNIAITRRWVCLDHGRVAIDASIELLREPPISLVAEAHRILPSMSELELCASDALLQTGVAPPPSPEARPAIELLQREIKQGRALWIGTERDAAVEALEQTVARARELGHDPTLALALMEHGYAQIERQESTLALESFRAAALAADRGGADLVRGGALEEAARKLADLGRFDDAHDALRAAEAVLERVGVGRGFHRARLEVGRAWVAEQAGKPRDALEHYRLAAAQLEESEESSRADTLTTALDGEARALFSLGKHQEAVERYKAAIAYTESHFEPGYIMLGKLYGSLGAAYSALDEPDLAAESFTNAYDIKRLYVAEDDPAMAILHLNIAALAFKRGDYEAALKRFEEALAAARNSEDRTTNVGFMAMGNIAACLSRMGRYEEALETQRTVLAERVRLQGEDHVRTAHARAAVGMTLLMLDRPEEARGLLLTALEDTEAAVGSEHDSVVWILLGLADVHVSTQEAEEALAVVRRIEALGASVPIGPAERCAMHHVQAQAWRLTGRARADWEPRAQQAVQSCVEGHLDGRADEIRTWIES